MYNMRSVFFDFHLPNATTWFYVSAIVTVSLFFRFNRPFSLRNLDLFLLFMPMPGFLLLLEGGTILQPYGWLVFSSTMIVIRCLVDGGLVKRAFQPTNINVPGLVWISCALFVGLIAVTLDTANQRQPGPGGSTFPVEAVRAQGEEVLQSQARETLSMMRFWTERFLTLACHAGIITGLVLFSWRHFGSSLAGLAVAATHLLLPYCYLLIPYNPLGIGRWEDTWPMAVLIWALFWVRRPLLAGSLVGLSIGTVIFPLFVVPAWIGYYGWRSSLKFCLTALFTCLCCFFAAYFSGLYPSLMPSPNWIPWQAPSPGSESLWRAIPWAYRIPLFVLHILLALFCAFRPIKNDIGQLLAQNTMMLAAIQWWLADRGGIHVLWYLPLLLLVVFRPGTVSVLPPSNELPQSTEQAGSNPPTNRPSRRGPLGIFTRRRAST